MRTITPIGRSEVVEGEGFSKSSGSLPSAEAPTLWTVKSPLPIRELVSRFLERNVDASARRSGRRTLEVFKAFESIGPPVTDHAEPSSFRRGRLTLQVRSSAWLTELGMMKTVLLDRLNARLPNRWVTDVRLVLGSPRPRARAPVRSPPLSPKQREDVETWSAGIEDPKVREAFERAAAKSLAFGPTSVPPFEGPPGPRTLPVTPWGAADDAEAERGLTYGYGDRSIDRWQLRRSSSETSDGPKERE